VVDSAATVVPYVPGGAGTAIKAARGLDAVGDVINSGDKLGDFAHNYQRSVGASQRVPSVLQSGGNKLSNRTSKGLNEHFGENLTKRDWGRALESLKRDHGVRNDHHGRILDNGDYVNDAGDILGNLSHYLP